MVDQEELSRSYRDLAKLYGTISSGLFVATGIGISLFSTSINSGLSLAKMGVQAAQKPVIGNSTYAANLSQSLTQSSVTVTNASDLGIFLAVGTLISAMILAMEGHYNWRKAHKILLEERLPSKKPYLLSYIIVIAFYVVLFIPTIVDSF